MTRLLSPLTALVLVALACESGPSTETLPPPCVESETLTLGSLLLELESDFGTVRGVDLDDFETIEVRSSRAPGCAHEDWPDPDGSYVDSNFAALAPTIEAAYRMDPRGIFVDNALTLDVEGRGDGVCAAVSVTLADGPRRTAEWNGSTLRAYHLGDLPLRLTLPGASGTVTLHDAAARMTLTGGRIATVVLSGGLEVEEIVPIAADSTIDLDAALIRTSLEGIADLEPDERDLCTQISVGFEATLP